MLGTWLLSKGIPVNTITAIVLFLLGCISYYFQTPHNICMDSTTFNWFGIGEMPIMWWTMAVAHLVLHDCKCPCCGGWK